VEDGAMRNTSNRYSPEIRERAVRLFQEHVHAHPTRWDALRTIARRIGCTTETLRAWVLKAEAAAAPHM
jgi:transposase